LLHQHPAHRLTQTCYFKFLPDSAQLITDTFGSRTHIIIFGRNTFEFKRVGPARLYFVPCGIVSADSNRQFDSPRFESFLKLAREKFDFVILDAAPIGKYPEPQTICSKVDGVVMVITSGKTRRQVAQRVKNEVEDAGGTVLGVVINRRKYYIPEWIYKRL